MHVQKIKTRRNKMTQAIGDLIRETAQYAHEHGMNVVATVRDVLEAQAGCRISYEYARKMVDRYVPHSKPVQLGARETVMIGDEEQAQALLEELGITVYEIEVHPSDIYGHTFRLPKEVDPVAH
jgi:isopropylmalate/homocitrate/citramalate synthase